MTEKKFDLKPPAELVKGLSPPLNRALSGGLLGGGAGALISGGLAFSRKRPNESKENRRRRIFRQALLGAGMGAPVGAAAGYFTTPKLQQEDPKNRNFFESLFAGPGPDAGDRELVDAVIASNGDITGREFADPLNDKAVSAAGVGLGAIAAANTDFGSRGFNQRRLNLRGNIVSSVPGGSNIAQEIRTLRSPNVSQVDSDRAAASIIHKLTTGSNANVYTALENAIAGKPGTKEQNMYTLLRHTFGASHKDAAKIIKNNKNIDLGDSARYGTFFQRLFANNVSSVDAQPWRDGVRSVKRTSVKGGLPVAGALLPNYIRHRIYEGKYKDRQLKIDILNGLADAMRYNGGDWRSAVTAVQAQVPKEHKKLVPHMMSFLAERAREGK